MARYGAAFLFLYTASYPCLPCCLSAFSANAEYAKTSTQTKEFAISRPSAILNFPNIPAAHSATPAPTMFEPLITVEEAARHLRLHSKTLQRFAREGRLPCVKLGKYWLFRLSALDRWIEEQQNRLSQSLLVS